MGNILEIQAKETTLNVVEAEKWVTNFEEFNSIQNRYNLKRADKDVKFPKYLVIRAYQELIKEAKAFYMDASKFIYVSILSDECGTWQVDFYATADCRGAHVSFYGICYDSKRKSIQCYGFDMGR